MVASDAAIKQMEADIARLAEQMADVRQAVALFGPIAEQTDHVAQMANAILDATAGPDGVPAWHAALAAISTLSDKTDQHGAVLLHIEAAHAAFVSRLDRVEPTVADAIALATRPIRQRQIVLTIAILALAILLVIHSYEVARQLAAAAASFLAGIAR